jgi:hypothetical protein
MAVSKISTSSPIQLYRVRTILRSFSGKRRDINPRAREQEAG